MALLEQWNDVYQIKETVRIGWWNLFVEKKGEPMRLWNTECSDITQKEFTLECMVDLFMVTMENKSEDCKIKVL
jgi:hypothetical protein